MIALMKRECRPRAMFLWLILALQMRNFRDEPFFLVIGMAMIGFFLALKNAAVPAPLLVLPISPQALKRLVWARFCVAISLGFLGLYGFWWWLGAPINEMDFWVGCAVFLGVALPTLEWFKVTHRGFRLMLWSAVAALAVAAVAGLFQAPPWMGLCICGLMLIGGGLIYLSALGGAVLADQTPVSKSLFQSAGSWWRGRTDNRARQPFARQVAMSGIGAKVGVKLAAFWQAPGFKTIMAREFYPGRYAASILVFGLVAALFRIPEADNGLSLLYRWVFLSLWASVVCHIPPAQKRNDLFLTGLPVSRAQVAGAWWLVTVSNFGVCWLFAVMLFGLPLLPISCLMMLVLLQNVLAVAVKERLTGTRTDQLRLWLVVWPGMILADRFGAFAWVEVDVLPAHTLAPAFGVITLLTLWVSLRYIGLDLLGSLRRPLAQPMAH